MCDECVCVRACHVLGGFEVGAGAVDITLAAAQPNAPSPHVPPQQTCWGKSFTRVRCALCVNVIQPNLHRPPAFCPCKLSLAFPPGCLASAATQCWVEGLLCWLSTATQQLQVGVCLMLLFWEGGVCKGVPVLHQSCCVFALRAC